MNVQATERSFSTIAAPGLGENEPIDIRKETHLEATSLRLLLIEDEPSDSLLAIELIRESMPDFGWEIHTASSITDAITLLSSVHYDLALVDLGLRDTNGPQTVDILCMVAPYIPIVVYSGTENDEILMEALHRGAFICLSKDHTTHDLMRTALTNALTKSAPKM